MNEVRAPMVGTSARARASADLVQKPMTNSDPTEERPSGQTSDDETESLPEIYDDVAPADVASTLRRRDLALRSTAEPGREVYVLYHKGEFRVLQRDKFTPGARASWTCDASHIHIVASDPESEFVTYARVEDVFSEDEETTVLTGGAA